MSEGVFFGDEPCNNEGKRAPKELDPVDLSVEVQRVEVQAIYQDRISYSSNRLHA